MNLLKPKHIQIYFIILAALIWLLAYSLAVGGSNLFQWCSAQLGLSSTYAHENLKSLGVVIIIMSVSLFDRFQQTQYQLYLMLFLIITLLCVHVSPTNYFLLLAIARVLNILNQAWVQLYVFPKIRATVAGIILSLTGFIDLRSIKFQEFWEHDIVHGQYIRFLILFCFILFWICVRQLRSPMAATPQPTELPVTTKISTVQQIIKIIRQHPITFMAFFLGGLNTSIVYFAYSVATTALPQSPPKFYEYAIYLGVTTLPFISGRLADKLGIRLMMLIIFSCLTTCIFLSGFLFYLHLESPVVHYIVVFLEAGLGSSAYGLACALLGSKIDARNIFRAFTLGLLFNYLGSYLYAIIFDFFGNSFATLKWFKGGINFVGTGILIYYFFRTSPQSVCRSKN